MACGWPGERTALTSLKAMLGFASTILGRSALQKIMYGPGARGCFGSATSSSARDPKGQCSLSLPRGTRGILYFAAPARAEATSSGAGGVGGSAGRVERTHETAGASGAALMHAADTRS